MRRTRNLVLYLLTFLGVTVTLLILRTGHKSFFTKYTTNTIDSIKTFEDFSLYMKQVPPTLKAKRNDQQVHFFTHSVGIAKDKISPSRKPSKGKVKGQNKISSKPDVLGLDQTDARVINYIRKHHLAPPPKPTQYPGHQIATHMNGYSSYISDLFRKRGSGYKGKFLEVGAYDGITASNSLYLEEIGWTGVLIECNPLLLPKLKVAKRKAWIADVCLSTKKQPQMMNFTTLQEWPASAKLGRPLNAAEMKKHGIDWVKNKTWINYEIPCFPLYSVLKATNITELDFLSLDVEGAEIDILKTFPFKDFKIKSMIVEVHTFSKPQKDELRILLEDNGFMYKKSMELDEIYILRSEKDLAN